LHDCSDGGRRGVFAAQFEMKSQNPIAWALLLVVPIGFAGVWRLQHTIDAQRESLSQERDDVLLRSGKLVKAMSLEYAPLLADIYWTRVVQYYGNKHVRGQANLELLWPLLDITTTLDPNLLISYRFGAMFLSQAAPSGAGRPDLAVQLIQRGIQANPDYWRLYEDLGFVYYFDLKDYQKASEAFLEGSKKPNAQLWMKVMAAKIAAEGESFATSAFLWKDIYDSTADPSVKKNALLHLQLLKVKEDCKQLDALADEYARRYGKRPARMSEMVQAGLLQGIPGDPLGFAYVFGEDGKAELNLASPLLEQQLLLERVDKAVPRN
jgi:tetratricopeptide (TPR) repeat protein